MKGFLYLILLMFGVCTHAQEVTTIAATIIDSETKEAVPFVNIGFPDKGIGTVSNENGNFALTYRTDQIGKRDVLQISSIGYETIFIKFENLNTLISYKTLLPFVPSETELETVVVKAEKRQFEKLGSSTYSKAEMAYWRNIEGLGGELATQIDIGKTNTLLHDLKFNIIENLSDSLLVRVNIYEYYRNAPGKNLANKDIFHVIRKKKGVDTIPLRDYNIMVHDDIVVSLELVEVYGDAIYLALSTTPYGGTAFKRAVSQDRWTSYPGIGLGFNLMSSYSEAPTDWTVRLREKPKRISLYWDASLNMKTRDRDEEFSLLSNYIDAISKVRPEIDLRVITFSNKIRSKKDFVIERGRLKNVIDYLKAVKYHGSTSYEDLLKSNEFNADAAIVFTDGTAFGSRIESKAGIPIYIVNSNIRANHKVLDDVSFSSGGQYIDLSRLSAKRAVKYMLEFVNEGVEYNSIKQIESDKGKVYGVVYNEQGPIQGALVRIKNTYTETQSEPNGRYKINAKAGDILEIRALGMKPKDTMVGELKKMHVPMKPEGELLDMVTVTGTKSEEEIVKTPFGEKKKASLGYSTGNSITSEEIEDYQVDLEQVLQKIPGVVVDYNDGVNKRYLLRKMQMTTLQNGGKVFPAIIVEGMAYDQNTQRLPFINPQEIESITVLSTAASTIRYGQVAAYGAIVIDLKEGSSRESEVRPQLEKAEGNEYNEQVLSIETASMNAEKPDYLLELEVATDFESAKTTYYDILRQNELPSVSFFLDVGRYFRKWNADFSNQVLSNITEIAPHNIKALKSLAYTLESFSEEKLATPLYERIVNLQPAAVQSYLDLARNYKRVGEYRMSATLYKQMVANSIPKVDFNDVGVIVFNEFKQLIAQHKSKIDFSDIPNELMRVGFKKDLRLVVEWNDPMADFELQFITPGKKYFPYVHNLYGDQEMIKKEMEQGFSIKEFDIEDADRGKWTVNVKYSGPRDDLNPTLLKYTLYRNFGLPDEERIIKTVKLQDFDGKVTLDSFVY